MHFLIDASLPRSAADLLRRLGHDATDVRDAGMRDTPDNTIADYARRNHHVLITRDFDFADIRNYPPWLYEGILVLKLREDATAGQVVKVLETFVSRPEWLARFSHCSAEIRQNLLELTTAPRSKLVFVIQPRRADLAALFGSALLLRCSLSARTSPPATIARKEFRGSVLFQHLSGTAHSVSWTF